MKKKMHMIPSFFDVCQLYDVKMFVFIVGFVIKNQCSWG